jgi:hypothetical protein
VFFASAIRGMEHYNSPAAGREIDRPRNPARVAEPHFPPTCRRAAGHAAFPPPAARIGTGVTFRHNAASWLPLGAFEYPPPNAREVATIRSTTRAR